MSRPPRARKQVLDAAERIVKAHGAANLTFEELVQESGISRGGITYHFATKDDLLRALIERDLEQGKAEEARFRAAAGDGPAAELIAQIRAWSRPDADRKRFVAGMLRQSRTIRACSIRSAAIIRPNARRAAGMRPAFAPRSSSWPRPACSGASFSAAAKCHPSSVRA